MADTCANCLFYRSQVIAVATQFYPKSEAYGCHRSAPAANVKGPVFWPLTGPDEWCGQWTVKP